MKFKVDKEAKEVLDQLLDLALKQGGMHNLQVVNMVIVNTTIEEEAKDETITE